MRGNGALAIWFRVDAADVADLDEWYPRQHLPERLSVAGFLRGRRYAAATARLPYFTLYETVDAGVLSSAAYLQRLNAPTEWTRRVLPTFREMVRNACRRLAVTGDDRPQPHLLTVRIKPDSGRGPHVRAWLEREAAATLGGLPAVTGGAAYVSDTGGTSVPTVERDLVGGPVVTAAPFVALLEVAEPRAEPALREFWDAWARQHAAEVTVDLYRLMYGLAWL